MFLRSIIQPAPSIFQKAPAAPSTFFRNMTNTRPTFQVAKRFISSQKSVFKSQNGCVVEDYVITNPKADNKHVAFTAINKLLSQKNAIYLLTLPSRFLRKEGVAYVPFKITGIEDLLKLRAVKNKLIPDPGHICAALTNHNGTFFGDLSFRPDQKTGALANTETALHLQLYDSLTSSLKRSSFVPFESEVNEVCRVLEVDPSNKLYLTVITGAHITNKLSRLCDAFETIKDANNQFYMAVYNLCTSFIKDHDLQKIEQLKDPQISRDVKHLIEIAEQLPQIAKMEPKGRRRIAAQACGHAIAKAFLQDAHALEKEIGLDLTTQHYAAYITANIIDDQKYINETPLLDSTADAIQGLGVDEEQNNNPKLKR